MKLKNLLNQAKISKEVMIPETWGQGRTVFGGLIAALLVKHGQNIVGGTDKLLRNASITFVGPVAAGVTASIQTKILRSSQSSSIIEVQLLQNDEIRTTMILCFGVARNSVIKVNHRFDKPNLAPKEKLNLIPYIPSLMPEFTQHFDFLLADGDMPMTKSSRSDFSGWMKFKATEEILEIDLAHLFILMDMWPTSVIQMFDRPAPASTLTWNFDLIGSGVNYTRNEWWKFEVESEYALDGYNYEIARLWDENDNLIAVSKQTVSIYL